MRRLRSACVPALPSLSHEPVVLADLRLEVVTPMFGGGVNTSYLDESYLIRPASIRGHLRFWWRACHAAAFGTAERLHKRERAFWGSAAKKDDPTFGPGAIGLHVSEIEPGTKFTHQSEPRPNGKLRWFWQRDDGADARGPDYALFPFTPQPTQNRGAVPGRVGTTFRLRLTVQPHAGSNGWPDAVACKRAAERALWAWITFGGIGSRTRRGCGTLRVLGEGDADDNDPETMNETPDAPFVRLPATRFIVPADDVSGWLKKNYGEHVRSVANGGVPLMPSLAKIRLLTRQPTGSPIRAWSDAIEPMFRYRQGPGTGRKTGGGNRPGESFWSEPSAVRAICGIPPGGHKITPGADGRDFPRADFGLPILFQNMGPSTPTLEGAEEGRKRMASPIILKALPLDDGRFAPLALRLDTPHLWTTGAPAVQLRMDSQKTPVATRRLDAANEQPTWPFEGDEPRHTLSRASVRDAFMDYLRDLGWR